MDIEEFRKKVSAQSKKDGKEIIPAKDVLSGITESVRRIYERGESNASEERDEDIKTYNETLYLLYGTGIGILGSILIQSIFEIIKIVAKEEYHLFILSLLIMISIFFLTITVTLLIKVLQQSKKSAEFNNKKINSARKGVKDADKARDMIEQ
ncbi:MAG: hypothetical protein WC494_03690 [Candidatus Pacearchaeota archaeon]